MLHIAYPIRPDKSRAVFKIKLLFSVLLDITIRCAYHLYFVWGNTSFSYWTYNLAPLYCTHGASFAQITIHKFLKIWSHCQFNYTDMHNRNKNHTFDNYVKILKWNYDQVYFGLESVVGSVYQFRVNKYGIVPTKEKKYYFKITGFV